MNPAQGSVLSSVLPEPHFETIIAQLVCQGWCLIPNFLEDHFWQQLATEAESDHEEGAFRLAGVGHKQNLQVRPEIRNDHVKWLQSESLTAHQAAYLLIIESLRQRINQALYLGLFGFEGHLAVYPEGSFYRRHLDQFSGTTHRTISCITYLNRDWLDEQGGALRVYSPSANHSENHFDIFPKGGAAVLFFSETFEHEVLPATRKRLSLTGWFVKRQ